MTELVTKELVQELAREIAFGYFTPEELAERYQLPPTIVDRLKDSPQFRAQVLRNQREIDEKGEQITLMARKSVQVLVPEIAAMAADSGADYQDRLTAFSHLTKLANLAKEDTNSADAFSVNIQINTG